MREREEAIFVILENQKLPLLLCLSVCSREEEEEEEVDMVDLALHGHLFHLAPPPLLLCQAGSKHKPLFLSCLPTRSLSLTRRSPSPTFAYRSPDLDTDSSGSAQESSDEIPSPKIPEEDEAGAGASRQEYSAEARGESSSRKIFQFFRLPRGWFGRSERAAEEETSTQKKRQENEEEFEGLLAFNDGYFQIEWREIVDPTPENVLALLLTGLLGLAILQIFWQLFLVAITITLAGLKYSVIAVILLALLIVFL